MSAQSRSSRPITLSLPREGRWTLHHVLLHRIEREEESPTTTEPPSLELFQAFETLDNGGTSFTGAQLEAIRDVLAVYRLSTDWGEAERVQLERLSNHVSAALETGRADPSR